MPRRLSPQQGFDLLKVAEVAVWGRHPCRIHAGANSVDEHPSRATSISSFGFVLPIANIQQMTLVDS